MDEGTEPIELSEASVERVAGRLAELVAPRLLSQHQAVSSSRTSEEEGRSQQGEKHINRVSTNARVPRGGSDIEGKVNEAG